LKTLYLECNSGISGDMTAAALLDLGADQKGLYQALESLGVDGYRLECGRTVKQGIRAYDFNVILDSDDPHIYSHGHSHEHSHRNLADVTEIIQRGKLTPQAKELALAIFKRVALAEAKVHGKPLEEVHFHEVGAIDSIIDIVTAAFCIDNLGIEKVYCSPLSEGTGMVRCAHGLMPVPAPATAEIAAAGGLSLQITEEQGEMVTPTGAAIAAELSHGEKIPGPFRILKTGYGAGKKEFIRANLLRVHLVELEDWKTEDTVCELLCNLDNMTGEQLGFAMERLWDAGALDVWFTSIQMKKNRPGVLLSVLCPPEKTEEITDCILRHTGTLGVRRREMTRKIMKREISQVETPYGPVEVKRGILGDLKKVSAEYESARRTAIAADVPIKKVYHAAEQEN